MPPRVRPGAGSTSVRLAAVTARVRLDAVPVPPPACGQAPARAWAVSAPPPRPAPCGAELFLLDEPAVLAGIAFAGRSPWKENT